MDWVPILAGLIPSIGVGLLFWYAMRAVVRADRHERAALAHSDDAADDPAGETPGDEEHSPHQG
ncbi:hypothetical protein [Demequina aestuarii]|uniref:hypothetical protein n=1 Tax=Demequina aestuarii TaxID=327095 RepID=UPI0007813E74|nr:hypothetical protein [Demequina aestuarii]